MKICSKCTLQKPYSDFYKAVKVESKDGFRTWCKNCMREYSRNYRKENLDKTRQYNANWFSARPTYRKDYMKKWHQENKDKDRQWWTDNRERANQYSRNRRAWVNSSQNPISFEDWSKIVEFYRYKCFYCGEDWKEMDHFIPLSQGGTHTIDNVVPSCQFCNRSKSDKDPFQFIQELKGKGVYNGTTSHDGGYLPHIT